MPPSNSAALDSAHQSTWTRKNMDCCDWEFVETAFADGNYFVIGQGPLHGPVSGFSITRDKTLDLVLETTSAYDSQSNAIPVEAETVFTAEEEVHFASHSGSKAVAAGVIPRCCRRTITRNLAQDRRPRRLIFMPCTGNEEIPQRSATPSNGLKICQVHSGGLIATI